MADLRTAASAMGPPSPPVVHPEFSFKVGATLSAETAAPLAALTQTLATNETMLVGLIPDATIYGHLFLVASGGKILRDSIFLSRDVEDIVRRSSIGSVRLAGTALVAGNNGAGGFYHWMAQVLPAVIHGEWFTEDFCYVVPRMKPWMRDGFSLVANGRAPVLELPADHTLHCERALYSRMVSRSSFSPHPLRTELRDRIKRKLRLAAVPPHRRLYVSRQDTKRRPLLNEEAVVKYLSRAGFDIVVPGSLHLRDQVRLFHEAELVIGPHGGGLTNILFCQEGAKVYELFQSDVPNACMATLCQSGGLAYTCDFFPSTGGRRTSGWSIDLRALERTLTSVLGI